jgi:hypothetical protein
LYHSPDDIRKIKQNDGIGVAYIWEGMEERRYWNKFPVGKPERDRICGRPSFKFKVNFKVVLKV